MHGFHDLPLSAAEFLLILHIRKILRIECASVNTQNVKLYGQMLARPESGIGLQMLSANGHQLLAEKVVAAEDVSTIVFGPELLLGRCSVGRPGLAFRGYL